MRKIIHLTDPHIVSGGRRVMGLDPVQRFEAVLAAVRHDHTDAVACIITGDLTDLGDRESFVLFRDLIAEVPVPMHLTLGNHDRRSVFLDAFPAFQLDGSGFTHSSFAIGDVRCVILDTLDERMPRKGRSIRAVSNGLKPC